MIALYVPLSIQQVVRWLVNEQYDVCVCDWSIQCNTRNLSSSEFLWSSQRRIVRIKWHSFRAALPLRHGRRRIFQAFALLSDVCRIVTKGRFTLELWWWTGGRGVMVGAGWGGGCSVFVFSDRADLYGAYSACYKICVSHPFEIFYGQGRCMSNEFCGLVSLCRFRLPAHQSRPFIYSRLNLTLPPLWLKCCVSYELYPLKEQCEEKLHEQNIKYSEETNFIFSLRLSIPSWW
jgi:hypothetical protein